MSKVNYLILSDIEDISEVYQNNASIFQEAPDVLWNLDQIEADLEAGWILHIIEFEDDAVAVILTKKEGKDLLSRNSLVKLVHQGKGISHQIKEYIEEIGTKEQAEKILNICHKNNFRGISLNETHGYKRVSKEKFGSEHEVWEKKLKK